MSGLLDAFKQYINDVKPGGLLNPELTRQGVLDAAALATIPAPILGDAIGLLADANRYATDPSSRTPLNYGLTATGLLPFVPAMGIVKQIGNKYGVIGQTYPYKNKIKSMGGKWAAENKAWMFDDIDTARSADKIWGGSGLLDTEKAAQIKNLDASNPRIYLNVPYEDKEIAKRLGAQWDSTKKKWFVRDSIPEGLLAYDPVRKVSKPAASSSITGLPSDNIAIRERNYKNFALEGGEGYNPYTVMREEKEAARLIADPDYWKSIAEDYKEKAIGALHYDADGWLDEAARKKNYDSFMEKAQEALEKAKALSK